MFNIKPCTKETNIRPAIACRAAKQLIEHTKRKDTENKFSHKKFFLGKKRHLLQNNSSVHKAIVQQITKNSPCSNQK